MSEPIALVAARGLAADFARERDELAAEQTNSHAVGRIVGHAKYFGTDSRGDVFLTGTSLRGSSLPVWWDKWVVVAPDGTVTDVANGKVFGHDAEKRE